MSNVKQCQPAESSGHHPCPFCGGSPEIFNYERGYASFVYVLCAKCGARTKAVEFPTYNNCPGDITLACAERDAFRLWDETGKWTYTNTLSQADPLVEAVVKAAKDAAVILTVARDEGIRISRLSETTLSLGRALDAYEAQKVKQSEINK